MRMLRVLAIVLLLFRVDAGFADQSKAEHYPAFAMGQLKAPRIVELFFSPGCPDCFLAFKNAVHELQRGPIARGEILLVGYIMPRNTEDLRIGQILMCGPRKTMASLVNEYMLQRAVGLQLTDGDMLKMLHKHQSGISSISECFTESREKALKQVNGLGIRLGIDDTPAWFVRGKRYQGVYFNWQLQKIFEKE